MLPAYGALVFPQMPELTRLQDAIQQSLRRLLGVSFLDGVLLTNINLTAAAPTQVTHGLGRAIVGWWVVDITAPAKVYRPASSLPVSILPLQADATTTVSVWVF